MVNTQSHSPYFFDETLDLGVDIEQELELKVKLFTSRVLISVNPGQGISVFAILSFNLFWGIHGFTGSNHSVISFT